MLRAVLGSSIYTAPLLSRSDSLGDGVARSSAHENLDRTRMRIATLPPFCRICAEKGLGYARYSSSKLTGHEISQRHKRAVEFVCWPASAQTVVNAKKILLVGGEHSSQLSIQDWLQTAGYEVVVTTSSGSILSLVATDMPSLILLDLDLDIGDPFTGNFDGFAAMHWLRNQVKPSARPPVIVILRTAESSEAERARGAGATAVLNKPVNEAELLGLVDDVLSHSEVLSGAMS